MPTKNQTPAPGMTAHTPGPWYWHTDSRGLISLRTPDRGNLIVMDFVRDGMQGAAPRLAYWRGLPGGLPRERLGGVLDKFSADHPDAALIASAPELLLALKEFSAAWKSYSGAPGSMALMDACLIDAEAAIARATGGTV